MVEFSTNAEKAEYVVRSIDSGKDADTVARELGYKHARSLDVFMRREGYYKEKGRNNYVPKSVKREDGAPTKANPSAKALTVMALYKDKQLTPKEIAREVGFENLREMADYMKSKGFVWDTGRSNYVPEKVIASEEPVLNGITEEITISESVEVHAIKDYLLLLQYLESRKEKLVQLLESDISGNLPRYVVPGVFITKSVHMSNQLDQMIRDYSAENNMSQRDIFEIALIDFFKKYGYRREVEVLLTKTN
jgi:hypothetical protein